MPCFAIITEDGLDQIVETKAQADKEKKDLTRMGCTVRVKRFESEAKAYEWVEAQGW